jgi:L-iditol 2-dehydrogenase
VKVRAVGICGSDTHGYTGDSGRRIPHMVIGHEATGKVVAVDARVSKSLLNQRIIIQPFVACGRCEFCQAVEATYTGTANLLEPASAVPRRNT